MRSLRSIELLMGDAIFRRETKVAPDRINVRPLNIIVIAGEGNWVLDTPTRHQKEVATAGHSPNVLSSKEFVEDAKLDDPRRLHAAPTAAYLTRFTGETSMWRFTTRFVGR